MLRTPLSPDGPVTATASPSFEHLRELAHAALRQRDFPGTCALAAHMLKLQPGSAEAHYLAGVGALELHRTSVALEHLHRAASTEPRRAEYAVQFARALVRGHRHGDALQVALAASALAPGEPLLLDALGTVFTQCQAHERAANLYRRAAALLPDNPVCRFNLAMSLVYAGRADEAERELDACLALAPLHWVAHGVLSRLRRQEAGRNHLDRLAALLASHVAEPTAAYQLNMALGKEHEDLGNPALAFEHFRRGKQAARARRAYAPAQDAALVNSLIGAFPAPPPSTGGCASDEPIFVMGMPRSGTTLVERIIASHPQVHAAGELENFSVWLRRLAGGTSPLPLDPDVVARASGLDWSQLGELYLASTRPATTFKPRFVDKFPHNFLYAGFIARALPNAKLICLRRHPLDTCLGNFREPFAEGSFFHGYAFDLLDIGRYYVQFDRLMAHWRRVLPGRVLEIDYEALVEAPEATTRRLLAHCELPWNDACLHFERNRAASSTASALQVRDPIHKAGVGRWKRYASELADLRELLRAAGIEAVG
ncbi:sulfotransferase [Frateuria sp. GZRR33]|uniref:sulfotransferase family protein n=1 Tax=Frateuria sp. GZRR33 TaxID=3351535 RepID=UPI003EDBE574